MKKPSCKITRPCDNCGVSVTRVRSQMRDNVFCGLKCSRAWLSGRMSKMNIELNPDRMIPETRFKLSEKRRDTGAGKTYTKRFSRHEHRIVAEIKLGRKLKPGEVVHHIDEDKRNNHPDNLIVFENQAAHAKHHMELRKAKPAQK